MSQNPKDSSPSSLEEMTLVGHLLELRRRLLWTLLWFVGAFALVYPYAQEVFALLVRPLAQLIGGEASTHRLIYTGLPEAFVAYIKVSLFSAFMLTFPVLAYQLWRFVMPGLYRTERSFFLLFILATPILFVVGAAFAYFGIIPLAWQFFLSYETAAPLTGLAIQLEARVSEYLSMTLQMMVAFGLSFQMPLVLLLCVRLGFFDAALLAEKRRYAIVLILILSAILTPPDVLSMLGLAIPLCILYELSIVLAKMIGQRVGPDVE